MARWDDATVDLVYLDPPFNSQATYNVLYAPGAAGDAQYRAFNDTWSWDAAAGERLERYRAAVARPAHKSIVGLAGMLGESGMLAYLTYMAERLEHMHRLLKPTGSLYLHCDPTASHYLRAVLDAIFGPDNFRNEIAWQRTSAHNDPARYGRVHDAILYYGRSSRVVWNGQFDPLDDTHFKAHDFERDEVGRLFRKRDLTAPAHGRESGRYEWNGKTPPKGRMWSYTAENMRRLEDEGRIVYTQTGNPRLKIYVDDLKGVPLQDMWTARKLWLNSGSRERLGYPTQKPLALLNRIIQASTAEGDVVLDPFCGCGTTVEAARNLGRRWCGIDISAFAVDLVKDVRLKDPTIPTLGIPADLAGARKLAAEKPFAFESWAVTRLPGFAPNTRQVGDGGIDGRATLAVAPDDAESRLALAQVKGGKFHASHFRDFRHVLDRESAAIGCYVTLDPSPAKTRADAKAAGRVHVAGQPYDRLQLWSMANYFDGHWPVLPVMTDPYSGKPINQPGLF